METKTVNSNEVIGKGEVVTETTSTLENTNNEILNKELRQIPINSLVVPSCHPRKNLGDLTSLRESISRDGLQGALTAVEKEDGTLLVVDGSRCLDVCKKLGWETVPCIVSPFVSDTDLAHRSYTINMERKSLCPIEEALHIKWMRDDSGLSFRELELKGYGSKASSSNKIKLLDLPEKVQKNIRDGKITPSHGNALAKLSTPDEQIRMAKQIIEHEHPVSKTKAMVETYLHKLAHPKSKTPKVQIPATDIPGVYFKDSRDMCEMPGNSVHLVMTSPPYHIGKDFESDIPYHEHLDQTKAVCMEIGRVIAPGGIAAINVADITYFKGPQGKNKESQVEPMIHKYKSWFNAVGMILTDVVIWKKPSNWSPKAPTAFNENTVHTEYRFLPNFDYVLIFRKKGERAPVPQDVILRSKISKEQYFAWAPAVWEIQTIWKQEGHSAQYPDELCYRVIKMFSFEGDTVLDPWLGSGTTIKVARELNRNGVGYERELRYKSLIMQKLGMDTGGADAQPASMAEFAKIALEEVEDIEAPAIAAPASKADVVEVEFEDSVQEAPASEAESASLGFEDLELAA